MLRSVIIRVLEKWLNSLFLQFKFLSSEILLSSLWTIFMRIMTEVQRQTDIDFLEWDQPSVALIS